MWRKPPHGLSIPYVMNEILIDTFDFRRSNIHFSDNSKIKQKVVCGYDPLFKVSYPFLIIMKGVRGVWTAINHVTIDKSLIKCMGRSVTYVQYMTENPIRYGIKVFFIFYALSAILIGLKVYVGQEDDSNNTALGTCDELTK